MKTISIILMSALLAFSDFPAKEVEKITVDKNVSTVTWRASKVTGTHFGKVKISQAELDYQNNRIQGGSFEIDMTSITVEDITDAGSNKRLTDHLKSDDFFSVDKFKTSSLKITEAKTSNGKDYQITGNLVIKGISNPVTFPATVEVKGGEVTATGNITFDRTKYDIKYRSGSFFEGLADRLIYDEVQLEVRLVAKAN
ncbi:YceI family protein [Cecembia calidifontis]|jgi:polyisoprenoid-binding protein YceI|uniref:Polyisoprenoid-binding protein YceI n=1 Tax=Cecembia calidifontis TaxID=1187080 RepID=A0A4Q7P6K1_9BACT|nr:YceI family protein [Cecembia calidifontis]RZS95605.1 polyisoprenoid-binding protein YceI [Cecembia calidifontis]